jgi:hypothetical protein
VSVALIIGTIIVYKQIQFAKDRPVGYTRNGLITIYSMNDEIRNHFSAVKDELIRTGVVASIAESEAPTTAIWGSSSGFSWKGKDPNLSVDFGTVNASYDYGKNYWMANKRRTGFFKGFCNRFFFCYFK